MGGFSWWNERAIDRERLTGRPEPERTASEPPKGRTHRGASATGSSGSPPRNRSKPRLQPVEPDWADAHKGNQPKSLTGLAGQTPELPATYIYQTEP